MRINIDPVVAVGVSVLLAAVYVGVLYLVPARVRAKSRNDPEHIKWRMATIAATSAALPFVLLVWAENDESGTTFADILGLRWEGLLLGTAATLLHSASLFLGPLVISGLLLRLRAQRKRDPSARFPPLPPTAWHMAVAVPWEAARNIVAAPITEELVFRSCVLALLLSAFGTSMLVILLSPTIFGVAHVHHFIQLRRQDATAAEAAAQCAFQFAYTTLFGMYAAFVWARTGNLVAAIACHAFCNLQGFPDVSFTHPSHPLHAHQRALLGCFVLGIITFVGLFFTGMWDPNHYASPWY